MELVPRRAQPSDAAALAQLHADTVVDAYAGIFPPDSPAPTPADLVPDYEALLDQGAGAWLVEDGGHVIGAIALVVDADVPAGWRIERFNVHPRCQSKGLGTALYRCAFEAARRNGVHQLNLWVLEANDRARAIYEAWGWRLVPGVTLANDPPEVLDVLYELNVD